MTEQISVFLTTYEDLLLFSALVLSLVIAATAEGVVPLRPQSRDQLGSRWISNLSLLLIGQVNSTWVIAASAVAIDALGANEEFGLAHLLGLGFWSSALVAILVFEFVNYWFHRALHRFSWLWRIHAVHHCDTELDCTTTFRNHPFELLVIAPITVPLVFLLGFPAGSVVFFQFMKALLLVFVHSNIRIPETVDRWLRLVIATPEYHRVHHAADRRYTDSNFSTILPLYDYLFGTYRKCSRPLLLDFRMGLEYLNRPADGRVGRLLLLPLLWHRMVPDSPSTSVTAAAGQEVCLSERV